MEAACHHQPVELVLLCFALKKGERNNVDKVMVELVEVIGVSFIL